MGVIVLGLFTSEGLSLDLSCVLISALAAILVVKTNFSGVRGDPIHSTSKSALS